MSSTEPLDPDQIRQQAAALAAHLQRSGVSFLPIANPEAVESWKSRFVGNTPVAENLLATESVAATPVEQPVEQPAQASGQSSDTSAESAATPPATTSPAPSVPAPSVPAQRQPATPSRLEPVAAFTSAEGDYPGTSLSSEDRTVTLQTLAGEAAACTRCSILSSCRTNSVFGEGNPEARFVFFGEGPGADEDRSGRPFVGKAGQLLTKMITACTLNRDDCYIMNTVKCRPPGNRNPEQDEIENCRAYYQQQLSTIRPQYIVCLGAVAAQELLGTKLSVGRLRGKMHGYFNSKVLVTYHPAYLLRNPAAKKAAWEDLQRMLADAGIRLP